MKNFHFHLLQDAVFGTGTLQSLPEILERCGGTRVMLVSDEVLAELGHVEKVKSLITAAGCSCTEFLQVEPNPTAKTVEACATLYQSCGANVTVVLGGGSPIDVAKAMRVVARYGGKTLDYEGTGKVPGPLDPLIAIPTTAGTGSEFTNGAVISDHERMYKTVLADPHMAARHVILDPNLLLGMPASVAASCGADAFIHAMEAYISRAGSPYSDALALQAMRLIGPNLRPFVACREDQEAAGAMMVGSALAGAALALGRLGLIHAMSHPISAFYDVPHGVANAVLVPAVLEYNALADRGKYAEIYEALTGIHPDTSFRPNHLIEAWVALNQDIGMPSCLENLGIQEEKFPPMARDTMTSPYVATNPRTFRETEVLQVFQAAMKPWAIGSAF